MEETQQGAPFLRLGAGGEMGPEEQETEADEIEAAEAEDDGNSVAARTYKGATKQFLPVSFTLAKAVCCKLCNKLSTDPSPLVGAHENDQYGGRRPWAKYKAVKLPDDAQVYRVPQANIDLICLNVWRLLNLTATGSIKLKPKAFTIFKMLVKQYVKRESFELCQSICQYANSDSHRHIAF